METSIDEDTGDEYDEYYGKPYVSFNGATLQLLYEASMIFANCPSPAPTKITIDGVSHTLGTPRNYYKNYYIVSLSDDDDYLPLGRYCGKTMTFTLE